MVWICKWLWQFLLVGIYSVCRKYSYEKVFNSENATQELRRIQYNIYSGLIKDIKNYQQILNDKKWYSIVNF